MPKLTVYVSDRLAEAVRRYDISISQVCQRALEAEIALRMPIMALTPRAREVLLLALREAEDRGHDYVGTEHLLLGLLREGRGAVSQVLKQLEVDTELRSAIDQLMSSTAYRTGSNRVLDRDGNIVGYLERDDFDNVRLVDEAGAPIRLPADG